MGNSTAYDSNGDVPVIHSIPWGAIRKAALSYKDMMKDLLKITLNGITYNIGKQAKEGLVVMGNGYSSVTFFLPDNREAVTEEESRNTTIYEYLQKLSLTDYAEIVAWDHFAAFVSNTMHNLLSDSEMITSSITYALTSNNGSTVEVALSGVGDFSQVSTAKAFFAALYSGLDDDSVYAAQSSNLIDWVEQDGAVAMHLNLFVADQYLVYPMWVGRK